MATDIIIWVAIFAFVGVIILIMAFRPRKINEDTIKNKVKELGVKYFETSAKLDENVDNVFEFLSVQILNNIK